jgi:TolB-like protein/Flp pilus assembly protein TadD
VAHELKGLATPAERAVVPPKIDRRSVVVIPFRFRTSVTEDQFLSVALADAVANRLASYPKLLVRPLAAVLKYAGTETEWTQVARELNADLVAEGTIQKMGPKIRVMIQVHQASDAGTLHSSRHDGDVDDLFGLQDRIADAVSDVFELRRGVAAEPAVPPTENALAYELYLRAVARIVHLNKFDIGSAVEILTRVVDLDPNFADAWGQLALAQAQMGMHLDPNPQWFERAEQAIAKTLELDPVQCDALCARAQIVWSPSRRFQNRAALRALNAALKVNPSRIIARQIRGAILFHLGFYDDSERDIRETLLINPGYAMAVGTNGSIALSRGDYQGADEWFDRTLAIEPSLIIANIFAPVAPIFLGRLEAAHERIRKARQMVPEEPQLTVLEGLIAAYEGNFQRAELLADDACSENQKSVTHTHHTWHHGAGVYAMCGKVDKAMAQLRRCAEFGLPNHLLFTSDPSFRSLHNHPEFIALMSDLRRQHDQFRTEFGLGQGDSGRLTGS